MSTILISQRKTTSAKKLSQASFARLLKEVRACRHCETELPLEPRPVLLASKTAKLLIVGQAPGIRVHESGKPWNDPSGQRLREWMGVDEDTFYDVKRVAIVPMGFCYPGQGKSGDLPPRPECAELWHERILAHLDSIEFTLLLGQYAHKYFLGDRRKRTLTETAAAWKTYRPKLLPMPHPSPRNNRWLAKNAWFEADVLPWLKRRVRKVLGS